MTRSGPSAIALLILALVVTACGDTQPTGDETTTSQEPAASLDVGASEPPEESAAPEQPSDGRLALVQERGSLICGVNGSLPGFSVLGEDGQMTGFDADFCRALAAAVLGDSDAVEFRELSADQRAPALQLGEIDVLIRNTTWTVSRDTSWGLFAPTTFYDGQAIMAHADRGVTELADLVGATICVQSGTTTELNLADAFRDLGEIQTQVFEDDDTTYGTYEGERCDAVTSDRSQLLARRTTFADPDAHVILEDVLSKEPLGPVAPLGDDEWFNVVKWTVFATIEAEELGIDSSNVAETAETSTNPVVQRLLGVTPEGADPFESGLGLDSDWVVDVISQVGNYAEIYDRNLGPDTQFDLERGLNSLWTDGGLLYAPPYR